MAQSTIYYTSFVIPMLPSLYFIRWPTIVPRAGDVKLFGK